MTTVSTFKQAMLSITTRTMLSQRKGAMVSIKSG